jgi:Rrf2 family protein
MALQLSTKGRYGVRALIRLAQNHGNGPLPINRIAREESIPLRYLEQIMSRLRKEGLVSSMRGPGGGYTLTRTPDRINVGEIISILEGRISLVRCIQPDSGGYCRREKTCLSRPLWSRLNEALEKSLARVSLQHLVDTDGIPEIDISLTDREG